jgi:hypothetical protein
MLFLLAMMFTLHLAVFNLHKKIRLNFLTTGIVAAIGLMCGSVQQLSWQYPIVHMISSVSAQNYSQDEIINYAKAGYEIELLRQRVYQQIKNSIDEPPPNIVCNQRETLQSLSADVRQIALQYCNDSRQIVQKHNLTIDRFNQLKQYYDRGDDFYDRVQNILINIQN